MAAAWGNEDFGRIDRWDSLSVAAGMHDEGWRSWDDAPEVDPAGRPIDFPDLDRSAHVALYSGGIEAAVSRDPRAGLLVSMHGQGLHEARLGLDGAARPRERQEPAVRAFIYEQEALQARLRTRIGGGEALAEWVWAGYRLLQAWDLLSLYLLWYGLPKGMTGTLAGVPRHGSDTGVDVAIEPDGDRVCTLRPYPFTEDEVVFPVAARVVPSRRYAGDGDLRSALADAPWITEEVGVRRGRAAG